MRRYENKVVLVTGAGSGMGKSYAYAYAKEGAKVIIGDINEENVLKVAEEIGGSAIGLKMDVSCFTDWENVVDKAHSHFGKIDILINNAGIANQTPFDYLDEETYRKSFDVNVMSIFYSYKTVVQDMKESQWGRIVNVSSIAGLKACGDNAAYATSKHAVSGLTKSSAFAFAPYNILVNSIHPGAIDTPMMDGLKKAYPEAIEQIKHSIPLKRFAGPDEIAGLVLFLTSEENTFITGEGIVIDGGQNA